MSAYTQGSKLSYRDYDPLSPRDSWAFYGKPYRWAIALTRPVRLQVLLGFLGSIIQSIMALVPGIITGYLIDEVFRDGDFTNFWLYIVLLFFIPVLRSLINFVKRLFFEYVSHTILMRTRDAVYQHLQKLDSDYYARTPTGRIMAKLTGDLEMVRHMFAWGGFIAIQDVMMLILGAVYLIFVEWRLALASYIFAPILFIIARRLLVHMKPLWRGIRVQLEELQSVVQQNIGANRITSAFMREEYEVGRFDKENKAYSDLNKDAATLRARYFPSMNLFSELMFLPVILVGGILAISGSLTVGEIVTFNNVLNMVVWPMFMLGFRLDDFQRFATSAGKIVETLMTKTSIASPTETDLTEDPDKADQEFVEASLSSPEFDLSSEDTKKKLDIIKDPNVDRGTKFVSRSVVSDDHDALMQLDAEQAKRGYIPDKAFPAYRYSSKSSLESANKSVDQLTREYLEHHPLQRINLRGDVVFDNVSYDYLLHGQKVPALQNVSFEVKAGQTIGIIGETGSGKTTLIELISRMMDPTEGRILIDGRNLKTYPLQALRRSIAVVPQDVFLFSDTIESNIAFSDLIMPFELVEYSAKVAEAYEFIVDIDETYDSMVGEEGVGLSGGQRQRLSLARAVASNPDILILDDTTSAVDMNTDARIRKNLSEHLQDKTVFMVAQRISSIRNADQIIVLKEGRVVEHGVHDELVALNGIYTEIYEAQVGDSKEALEVVLEQMKGEE